MFIYKITVLPTGQSYFGLDTKPEYKKARWKAHCKKASDTNPKYKIHKAIKQYGINNCLYEVVENGFVSIGKLALAEIRYIQQNDTYRNGLNSSLGGDGLGKTDLSELSEIEITHIKNALREHWREWNQKKWANTSTEDRKIKTKHLHTKEVYDKKSNTLKEFYKAFPGAVEQKREKMRITRNQNKEIRDQQAREAGLKGALVRSRSITVEFPDGNKVTYKSKSEMQRQTKQWAKTLIEKTKQGIAHNGYRAWEINE